MKSVIFLLWITQKS